MKNTSDHYDRVAEFMRLAKQKLPDSPTMPSEKVRQLRAKLILEEALETIHALGFTVVLVARGSGRLRPLGLEELSVELPHKPNLIQIADGCADIMVVTTGTLISAGIPDKPLQELVDQNNLDKLKPGHIIREDGKLIKPLGHKPPDIEGLLKELGHGD